LELKSGTDIHCFPSKSKPNRTKLSLKKHFLPLKPTTTPRNNIASKYQSCLVRHLVVVALFTIARSTAAIGKPAAVLLSVKSNNTLIFVIPQRRGCGHCISLQQSHIRAFLPGFEGFGVH
jgi:hypothetical protein